MSPSLEKGSPFPIFCWGEGASEHRLGSGQVTRSLKCNPRKKIIITDKKVFETTKGVASPKTWMLIPWADSITLPLVLNNALLGWAKKLKSSKCWWGQCVLVTCAFFRMCGNESQPGLKPSRKSGYAPDNHLETLGFPYKNHFSVLPVRNHAWKSIESSFQSISHVHLSWRTLQAHFGLSCLNRPNVGD